LNDTIAAIEKAMSAMKELTLPGSRPEQDMAPAPGARAAAERRSDAPGELFALDAVSWPEECLATPSPSKTSRPRRSPKRLGGSRAVTARDEFNIAAISEFDLKDALHPLLRRWIADLKLNPLRKQVIGADVAVPAALYKIIYDPELNRVNAFSSPMSITAGCRPPPVI
jgi:hypothetical protein